MRRLLIALVILGAAFYAAGALAPRVIAGPDPHSKDAVAASASHKRRPWPPKNWASGGNSYRADGSAKDEIRRHSLGLPIACRQVTRRALF